MFVKGEWSDYEMGNRRELGEHIGKAYLKTYPEKDKAWRIYE